MPDQLTTTELGILLVERSRTQQRIICSKLEQLGMHSIDVAANGADALTRMMLSPPDLVISAMYLDDMTGADLVTQMREDPGLEEIAFMLISSETDFEAIDPVRQAGSVAILPKPFQTADLVTALRATTDYINHTEADLDSLDLESLNVLVVDDSPMARKHISRVLGRMGIKQLTHACDGEEAVRLIEENFFDLVVTDYNMPQMDGQALTRHIREASSQRSVPILMVTSEQDGNRLAAVQQAGVSAICDKPFEPCSVRELIENLMSAA